MSLAERTREAVRADPFLYDALRAGVVNYTAAARYLDVGEEDAVAAALRRYATDLPPAEDRAGSARVTMESGLGAGDPAEALLSVGTLALAPGAGSMTGILATGDVGPAGLRRVLGRCETADIDPLATGVGGETLVVIVERRDGPDALRLVESVFDG